MISEQRTAIIKDIKRMISDIARKNSVCDDEIKSVLIDEFIDENDFVIICWTEIQELMDKEGFDTNALLANDEWILDKYGSSVYFVNKKWLNQID